MLNTGLFNAGHGWHLALWGHDVGAVWLWGVLLHLVLGVVAMARLDRGDEDA